MRTSFINICDIIRAVLPYLHCMMHHRGQIYYYPTTRVETILFTISVEFYACLPRLPNLVECTNNAMQCTTSYL